VAKPELGIKRTCPVTGKKFYDLGNDPVVSPYTGQSYVRGYFDPVVKGRSAAAVADEEEAEPEMAADAEIVSLDEAAAGDDGKDPIIEDDIDIEADIDTSDDDDTFLAEEEEDNDDVAGLIDGDIETDDEV
jgi:uncharacterized protein (TIGR02300 family)